MSTDFKFRPVVQFDKSDNNEIIRINSDLFQNYVGDNFVVSLILNDLSESSKSLISGVLDDIKIMCEGNQNESVGHNVNLEFLTEDFIRVYPVFVCTNVFYYNQGSKEINISFFISFCDLWDQIINKQYDPKSTNYWDTPFVRYEQQCVVNSFLHVISSFQLIKLPSKIKETKIQPEVYQQVIDHLFCYVQEMTAPSFRRCQIGVLLDYKNIINEKEINEKRKLKIYTITIVF